MAFINPLYSNGFPHTASLTRMCSGWGAIANPHAKVFDPPAPPSPNPGA